MALIKCPECGHDVSDKATSCPGCGHPLHQATVKKTDKHEIKTFRVVVAVVLIIVIIAVIWILVDDHKGKNRSPADYYQSSYSSNYSTPKTGNERALERAKSYLNSSAFSYSGLIKQLKFEGFSDSEAKYGANHCGADWTAQALKKAKSYSNTSAFSYSGLIKQLEFEGFTTTQATYGADNCGANWNEQAVKKAKSYGLTFITGTEMQEHIYNSIMPYGLNQTPYSLIFDTASLRAFNIFNAMDIIEKEVCS